MDTLNLTHHDTLPQGGITELSRQYVGARRKLCQLQIDGVAACRDLLPYPKHFLPLQGVEPEFYRTPGGVIEAKGGPVGGGVGVDRDRRLPCRYRALEADEGTQGGGLVKIDGADAVEGLG